MKDLNESNQGGAVALALIGALVTISFMLEVFLKKPSSEASEEAANSIQQVNESLMLFVPPEQNASSQASASGVGVDGEELVAQLNSHAASINAAVASVDSGPSAEGGSPKFFSKYNVEGMDVVNSLTEALDWLTESRNAWVQGLIRGGIAVTVIVPVVAALVAFIEAIVRGIYLLGKLGYENGPNFSASTSSPK